MQQVRVLAVTSLLAVTALLSGCGSPPATVSGEVSYEGQPVDKGYISFTPSDGQGKDAGAPIANGRYKVADLPAGRKLVNIIAIKKVNFASTSAEMAKKAAQARLAEDYD